MRVGGHPAFQERGRCRVFQPAFRPGAIPLPELPIPLLSFGVPAREEVVESVEVKSLARRPIRCCAPQRCSRHLRRRSDQTKEGREAQGFRTPPKKCMVRRFPSRKIFEDSQVHRQHHQLRHHGFLIGDGALNYAPEYLWESYYNARLSPAFPQRSICSTSEILPTITT